MVWIDIGCREDYPEGEAREIVAGDRIVAVMNASGQLYAMDGVCPHQGGPIGKGSLTDCVLTCPWHGWQFDVRDGQSLLSPAVQQPTFELQVDEHGGVRVFLPD